MRMYMADYTGRTPPAPRDFAPLLPYMMVGISARTGTYEASPGLIRCPDDPAPFAGPFILQTSKGPVPVQSSYMINPTVQWDDLPSLILAGDNAPGRHQGRRWVGVRLDGATQLYPAQSWEEKLGWVIRDEKATK